MVVGRRGRRTDVLCRKRRAWLYDKGVLIMGCWIVKGGLMMIPWFAGQALAE